MSEKPLYVQVAEVLGWDSTLHNGWIPRYDTDWSATGPLIEKYGISLWFDGGQWSAGWLNSAEYEGHWLDHEGTGEAPLIAVCKCILMLAKEGKLKVA